MDDIILPYRKIKDYTVRIFFSGKVLNQHTQSRIHQAHFVIGKMDGSWFIQKSRTIRPERFEQRLDKILAIGAYLPRRKKKAFKKRILKG